MREGILRIQRWKFFLCSIKAGPQGEDISSLSQSLAFWVTLGESMPFSSFFCLDHSFFKAGDASFCLVCTSAANQLHVGGKSRFPPFLLQHLSLVAVGRRSGCIGHKTPAVRPEKSFGIKPKGAGLECLFIPAAERRLKHHVHWHAFSSPVTCGF